MRYWIGAICLAVAAGLIIKGLRHRRQILSLATREALAAQHAAASADPRSMSAMGEIGRPLVLFFVGWLGVKAGLLYLLFHAGRWLSIIDLAGFYALLYAYGGISHPADPLSNGGRAGDSSTRVRRDPAVPPGDACGGRRRGPPRSVRASGLRLR